MLITEMAKLTTDRLNGIGYAEAGVEEFKALDDLCRDLMRLSAPIKLLSSNAKLFVRHGGRVTLNSEIGVTFAVVNKALTRFVEVPKASTLKNRNNWKALESSLELLTKKLGENQSSDWKNFFESEFFSGHSPLTQEAKLPRTPQNKEALEVYTRLYKNFLVYRSNAPKNDEEYSALRNISDHLSQIKFQEDVPEDVSKFFNAVGGGASLDLLTNGVLDWLRKNNLVNSYFVRAKYDDVSK